MFGIKYGIQPRHAFAHISGGIPLPRRIHGLSLIVSLLVFCIFPALSVLPSLLPSSASRLCRIPQTCTGFLCQALACSPALGHAVRKTLQEVFHRRFFLDRTSPRLPQHALLCLSRPAHKLGFLYAPL